MASLGVPTVTPLTWDNNGVIERYGSQVRCKLTLANDEWIESVELYRREEDQAGNIVNVDWIDTMIEIAFDPAADEYTYEGYDWEWYEPPQNHTWHYGVKLYTMKTMFQEGWA